MRRVVSSGGRVFVGVLGGARARLHRVSADRGHRQGRLAPRRSAQGGRRRRQARGHQAAAGQGRDAPRPGQPRRSKATREVFLELPDKFRRNESLSLGPGGPGIDRVEVLNGNDIWEENSGGGGRGGLAAAATSVAAVVGGDFGGFRRGGLAVRPERRRRSGAARRASIPSGSRNCSCETGAPKWRVCSSRSC